MQTKFNTGDPVLIPATIRSAKQSDAGIVYEVDASTLGVVGDGLAKIAQSFPEYITPEMIFDLTGV